MEHIFTQLAFIVGLAVILSLVMKVLHQPMIIGYIITGLIAGPSLLGIVQPGESIEVFAGLGVALLLFIVGLGLNPEMIRDVGTSSVITGVAQVFFTSIIGLFVGLLLGLPFLTSLYLAVAFTFSSTIIILRLLYEKEEQDTLYGRISIGFLLVQDLIAMLIFVFLSSTGGNETSFFIAFSWVFIKLAILVPLLYFLWKFLIPQFDRILMGNNQLLFIFAIALCFVMASIFSWFGFHLELGALVAGVLLSTSPYHREVASRIQPLRDFFLVIFFIFLGTNIVLEDLAFTWIPIVVFSLFILIGNPIIVIYLMTKIGHTRKVAFFAGLTVAQISEFSLIMIGIGLELGHVPEYVLGMATSVGLITIAFSSYMITYNDRLYKKIEPLIKFLTPNAKDYEISREIQKEKFEVLIIGAHRMGGGMIDLLKQRKKKSYLVIDHDPRLVLRLKKKKIPIIFGSADDIGFLDELNFSQTKLVICTVPDIEVNHFIISYLKRRCPKIQVIVVAHHAHHAKQLYKEGASYVVIPPYIGRSYVMDLFRRNRFNSAKYEDEKKRHLKDLKYLLHQY